MEEIGLAGGGPIVNDTLGVSRERLLSSRRRLRRSDRLAHRQPWPTRIPTPTRRRLRGSLSNGRRTTTSPSPRRSTTSIATSATRRRGGASSRARRRPILPAGQFNTTLRNGNEIGQPSTDEFTLSAVRVDWNFGPVALVSSSSYYKRNQSAVTDYSSVDRAIFLGNPYPQPPPQPVVAPGYWADNQNNWTQEVRLESTDKAARVSWTTGVFYQHANENTIENVYDPGLLTQLFGSAGDGCDLQAGSFQLTRQANLAIRSSRREGDGKAEAHDRACASRRRISRDRPTTAVSWSGRRCRVPCPSPNIP